MAEKQDIHVAHVMIGNPSIATVPNMAFSIIIAPLVAMIPACRRRQNIHYRSRDQMERKRDKRKYHAHRSQGFSKVAIWPSRVPCGDSKFFVVVPVDCVHKHHHKK